ncbi:uncharacterized protein LOC135934257 isoform X3 [Cloeon dipterum]|uniref:uncharacterized protein LOC135934257 isoform X3 n=1 Tax=Cloeon dipterum TaxID=197152 RepID=UPI00321F7FF1
MRKQSCCSRTESRRHGGGAGRCATRAEALRSCKQQAGGASQCVGKRRVGRASSSTTSSSKAPESAPEPPSSPQHPSNQPFGDGVAEQLLSMCTSRYSYQPPSNMMRARRKDASVRPNRWLDKKSSRGMLFENEELRLRTIEINAEVERGQGDIKKLKRQNEQLKREIWNLRDEYDKLESRMRRMKSKGEEDSEGEEDEYDEDDNQEREKRAEDDDNRQNAKIQSCSDYEDDEKKPLEDQPETGKDSDAPNKDSDSELAKEEKNEADVIIVSPVSENNSPNNWQNTQGYGTDGYTSTEESCEGCQRRYGGSQRCTPRRRVVSGGLHRQNSFSSSNVGEGSPNRLSLPVGLLEHGIVDNGGGKCHAHQHSCCPEEQQHQCGPQFGGPWWVLTPVTMPAVDCPCGTHDYMTHQAPLAPRPAAPAVPWTGSSATITEAASTPAVQSQQWAIAPYRGDIAQQTAHSKSTPALPVNGTPKTPRRRAPPPPPPKPTCEQVSTVCRASSVLSDGTTRRSVTFHTDSVTYIPPTPVNPGPLQPATYIPYQNTYAPENCPHDNDPRTCICSLHAQATFEESSDTVLMVRGLQRVPGLLSRELIDALENRLGPTLMRQSIRGVCLHQARPSATVVAASVTVMRKDVALRLLLTGLEIRGEMLQLEEENALCTTKWRSPDDTPENSHVLLVSGVQHQVSDGAVRTAVMRACGLRATQVRRHVYKGVDTGERMVRVAPPCMSYARLQAAAGSSGTIITEAVADCSVNSGSDSESKYRTHLSVQLRRPTTGSPTVDCMTEQRTIRTASPMRPVSLTEPASQSMLLDDGTDVVKIETVGCKQQATPPTRRLSRSGSQGVRVLPPQCNGNLAPPPYTPPPNHIRPPSNPPPPPPPAVPTRKAPAPQPKPTIAIEAAVVASTNSSAAREAIREEKEGKSHMRKSKSQEDSGSSAATSPTSNKTANKKLSQNGGILRRGTSKEGETQKALLEPSLWEFCVFPHLSSCKLPHFRKCQILFLDFTTCEPNSKAKALKSRSVSVESGARTSAPQRRKNGVFERPNSEDLLLDGRSSISSREGSNSNRTPLPAPSGSLPWCACWGNGCL